MTEGIDYNETFAPVPCLSSFRMLFAIAAKFDWEILQGDVSTAFLSAKMDTGPSSIATSSSQRLR